MQYFIYLFLYLPPVYPQGRGIDNFWSLGESTQHTHRQTHTQSFTHTHSHLKQGRIPSLPLLPGLQGHNSLTYVSYLLFFYSNSVKDKLILSPSDSGFKSRISQLWAERPKHINAIIAKSKIVINNKQKQINEENIIT